MSKTVLPWHVFQTLWTQGRDEVHSRSHLFPRVQKQLCKSGIFRESKISKRQNKKRTVLDNKVLSYLEPLGELLDEQHVGQLGDGVGPDGAEWGPLPLEVVKVDAGAGIVGAARHRHNPEISAKT